MRLWKFSTKVLILGSNRQKYCPRHCRQLTTTRTSSLTTFPSLFQTKWLKGFSHPFLPHSLTLLSLFETFPTIKGFYCTWYHNTKIPFLVYGQTFCSRKFNPAPTPFPIYTKAKCPHPKNLTCKGTLRQMFIRVYRLDIQSVMLVFSTHLCELAPL